MPTEAEWQAWDANHDEWMRTIFNGDYMTHFEGGPVAGHALLLRRSPEFLRVVIGPRGEKGHKVDALDQPGDQPTITETLYAYRFKEDKGGVFIRPGGFFRIADYVYIEEQPSQDVMRSARAWSQWCRDEVEKCVKQAEENCHYRRECLACGKEWDGLHCIHDLYQNPCPHCGDKPVGVGGDCDCEFDC